MNRYPNTPLIAMARAVLGVVVLCNVPLNIFPSRVSTLSLLETCSRGRLPSAADIAAADGRADAADGRGAAADGRSAAAADGAPRLFVSGGTESALTALFLFLTGGTALVVNDLGVVVALIGSTGATLLALVCPAAAYLLLARRAPPLGPNGCELPSSQWLLRALAAAMLGLGIAIVPSKLFCA